MTALQFLIGAATILGGVICLALAVVIIYCVVVGLRNHADDRRRNRGIKLRPYKGK